MGCPFAISGKPTQHCPIPLHHQNTVHILDALHNWWALSCSLQCELRQKPVKEEEEEEYLELTVQTTDLSW